VEEQQGTTSIPSTDQDSLSSSNDPLFPVDTYAPQESLPLRAIYRAGGSASDRMLSFFVRDFLQARRWGTLQLCVGRGWSPIHATGRDQEHDNVEQPHHVCPHIVVLVVYKLAVLFWMTFFANTLECLNQALLVRCTHNQVRVKLDVCEREVQMYGRIYGWKSGRKRTRAACGFYGQRSRLSERGEVSSRRRRGWGDEKCLSRGARRESLWVLRKYPPNQDHDRASGRGRAGPPFLLTKTSSGQPENCPDGNPTDACNRIVIPTSETTQVLADPNLAKVPRSETAHSSFETLMLT